MTDQFDTLRNALPIAPIKIATLEGCKDFAIKVNEHLVEYRHTNPTQDLQNIHYRGYSEDSYMVDSICPRFGTGEGKGMINASVRGSDLYIFADVTNYSLT